MTPRTGVNIRTSIAIVPLAVYPAAVTLERPMTLVVTHTTVGSLTVWSRSVRFPWQGDVSFKGLYKALDGTLSDNVRLMSGGGKSGLDSFTAFARRCDVGCVVLFSEKQEATVTFKGLAADPPVKGLLYLQVSVSTDELNDCPLCSQFGVTSLPAMRFVSRRESELQLCEPARAVLPNHWRCCYCGSILLRAVQGHCFHSRVGGSEAQRREQGVRVEAFRCESGWRPTAE